MLPGGTATGSASDLVRTRGSPARASHFISCAPSKPSSGAPKKEAHRGDRQRSKPRPSRPEPRFRIHLSPAASHANSHSPTTAGAGVPTAHPRPFPTGDRQFESIPLQERVCEPSVPESPRLRSPAAGAADCRDPRPASLGPCLSQGAQCGSRRRPLRRAGGKSVLGRQPGRGGAFPIRVRIALVAAFLAAGR
jgi:hypothetical protein